MRHAPFALLAVASLLPACLGGFVEHAGTGNPLDDVIVTGIAPCPDGDCYQLAVVRSEEHGVYFFDFARFNGDEDQPVTDEVYLLVYSKPGTCGATHFVNPQYELVTHVGGTHWMATAPTAYLSTDCSDSDLDGLPDEEELRRGTDPWSNDTDGDGLDDFAEVRGSNWVDLPAMGADPLRKDIFVEMDYVPYDSWNGRAGTQSYAVPEPPQAAIDEVVAAFAQAPNPDGSSDISLHLMVDDEIPWASARTVCGDTSDWAGTWQEFEEIKDAFFEPNRRPFVHYALFTGNFCNNQGLAANSGVARGIPGMDFLVTMGSKFDSTWAAGYANRYIAGTLMHELGHALGLGHAGVDAFGVHRNGPNDMPHYLSVMNYTYQRRGVAVGGSLQVDYSRFQVDGIDEANLSEEEGLTSSEVSDAVLDDYWARARIGGNAQDGFYGVWIRDASCVPADWSGAGLGAPTEGAGAMTDWTADCAISLDPATVAVDLTGDGDIDSLPDAHADWLSLDFSGNGVMSSWAGGTSQMTARGGDSDPAEHEPSHDDERSHAPDTRPDASDDRWAELFEEARQTSEDELSVRWRVEDERDQLSFEEVLDIIGEQVDAELQDPRAVTARALLPLPPVHHVEETPTTCE